jgi:hypothetical protein
VWEYRRKLKLTLLQLIVDKPLHQAWLLDQAWHWALYRGPFLSLTDSTVRLVHTLPIQSRPKLNILIVYKAKCDQVKLEPPQFHRGYYLAHLFFLRDSNRNVEFCWSTTERLLQICWDDKRSEWHGFGCEFQLETCLVCNHHPIRNL